MMRLARGLYTLLYTALLPLIGGRLWMRGRRAPRYRERFSERLGGGHSIKSKVLWIHAVSVGETIAIAPLARYLLEQYPEHQLVITTMTPTGAERVETLFGDRVIHRYCPWDHPLFWWRFLRHLHPDICIVVETELWPNMLAACARRHVPVILANARLSSHSAKGYQKVSTLTRDMMRHLTWVAAQDHVTGQRFVDLGLSPSQLKVVGSIKFDLEVDPNTIECGEVLHQQAGENRPVLIGASTHEGEDELLLECWQALSKSIPQLLLVLVPRHPERFDTVIEAARATGAHVALRSDKESLGPDTEIFIGNTMGELMRLYAMADVAFVGGSFSGSGGHNPLEPASLGKAVVMGPDCFNFEQITQALEQAQGLVKVADGKELGKVLEQLLGDAERRQQMGEAARQFVSNNSGALGRLQSLVDETLAAAREDQP